MMMSGDESLVAMGQDSRSMTRGGFQMKRAGERW